jgi:hypothetical protein
MSSAAGSIPERTALRWISAARSSASSLTLATPSNSSAIAVRLNGLGLAVLSRSAELGERLVLLADLADLPLVVEEVAARDDRDHQQDRGGPLLQEVEEFLVDPRFLEAGAFLDLGLSFVHRCLAAGVVIRDRCPDSSGVSSARAATLGGPPAPAVDGV